MPSVPERYLTASKGHICPQLNPLLSSSRITLQRGTVHICCKVYERYPIVTRSSVTNTPHGKEQSITINFVTDPTIATQVLSLGAGGIVGLSPGVRSEQ